MFLFPFPHSPEWLIVDLPKQNLNRILPGHEPRLFVFADQAHCLSQYHTAKGFTRKMYLELVYSYHFFLLLWTLIFQQGILNKKILTSCTVIPVYQHTTDWDIRTHLIVCKTPVESATQGWGATWERQSTTGEVLRARSQVLLCLHVQERQEKRLRDVLVENWFEWKTENLSQKI